MMRLVSLLIVLLACSCSSRKVVQKQVLEQRDSLRVTHVTNTICGTDSVAKTLEFTFDEMVLEITPTCPDTMPGDTGQNRRHVRLTIRKGHIGSARERRSEVTSVSTNDTFTNTVKVNRKANSHQTSTQTQPLPWFLKPLFIAAVGLFLWWAYRKLRKF